MTDKEFQKTFKNPCNKDHISFSLKISESETEELIEKLLKENKIEESKYAKEYYSIKN